MLEGIIIGKGRLSSLLMRAATNIRRTGFAVGRHFLWVIAFAGAGGTFQLSAAGLGTSEVPIPPNAPSLSGWVLADLNGDQNVDLATARSGGHDANGYAQEVRITLGAFHQTSFHFLSPGATVELSSQDVDGDNDGDLVVFEPLSSQPIGVWINDGAGSFHEGRLADFRNLWSERPGSAWRGRVPTAPVICYLRRADPVPDAVGGARRAGTRCHRPSWQNEHARRDATPIRLPPARPSPQLLIPTKVIVS